MRVGKALSAGVAVSRGLRTAWDLGSNIHWLGKIDQSRNTVCLVASQRLTCLGCHIKLELGRICSIV